MPVWETTPVSETPEITLVNWAVFELPDGDRHFAGFNLAEREGRASSRIVDFDPATMTGRTRSGRVYRLKGSPGLSGDGEYVWRNWLRLNGIQPGDAVNVSSQVAPPAGEEER